MKSERFPEKVIILHGQAGQDDAEIASLSGVLPQSELVQAHTLEEYLAAISQNEFDVVVLDYDLPEVQTKEILAQLRVQDSEPDVLLLSRCDDPITIRNIAKAQKRYVVRDEGWVKSMGQAIRDMLRIRRLEKETALLRARLTEANEKLESRNRRLDDFCATIAHDIRGPLASLVLKIEYILETQAKSFDDRTTSLLRRSIESTRRLVGVVQAMYEFARIGFHDAQFSETALTPLVKEVMADINIDHRNDVAIKMDTLPTIWGNGDLLRRVFLNLFLNAIKYNNQEKIEIHVRSHGVVQRGIGEFAEIVVSDNGPGIEPGDAHKVFNMFARGGEGERGSDGLGIGLAVVQRIVELHQGTIELVNDTGKGAQFRIFLPTQEVHSPKMSGYGS